jgi:hypothetical protein
MVAARARLSRKLVAVLARALASWPSQRRLATAISLPRRPRTKRRPRAVRVARSGIQEPAGVVKRSTRRIARVRAAAVVWRTRVGDRGIADHVEHPDPVIARGAEQLARRLDEDHEEVVDRHDDPLGPALQATGGKGEHEVHDDREGQRLAEHPQGGQEVDVGRP